MNKAGVLRIERHPVTTAPRAYTAPIPGTPLHTARLDAAVHYTNVDPTRSPPMGIVAAVPGQLFGVQRIAAIYSGEGHRFGDPSGGLPPASVRLSPRQDISRRAVLEGGRLTDISGSASGEA